MSIKCYHGNTGVPGTVDTQEEIDCPTDFDTCVKIDFKANGPPVGPHDTQTIRTCGLKKDREGMGITVDQCVIGEQEVCTRLNRLMQTNTGTLRANITAGALADPLQRVNGAPILFIGMWNVGTQCSYGMDVSFCFTSRDLSNGALSNSRDLSNGALSNSVAQRFWSGISVLVILILL